MARGGVVRAIERAVFDHRGLVLLAFALATLAFGAAALKLRVDAGFAKLLPLQHEYMQTFVKYRDSFGGANRILIALTVDRGDIFTPQFFETLKGATDEVFFIEGVDRARVQSLFTPNTRFTEVVEDGISGGNVVPADFQPTPEGLARVRENLLKSAYVGRLVANDFTGAMIVANLLEIDPATGKRIDYQQVAGELEKKIRERFITSDRGISVQAAIDVHIIGFAKVVGDITEGAARVVVFFGIAFVITAVFVYWFTRSPALTLIPLVCSLIAVVWQLGSLTLVGFGIDPMSILVPFLVFAIAVSHGVQMVGAVRAEVFDGADSMQAARLSFRRLLVPGGIALASDTIGFITILLIKIEIIQEMAITASLGVAAIILTNLVLLPVLLSFVPYSHEYRRQLHAIAEARRGMWHGLAKITRPRPASITVAIGIVLFVLGAWKATDIKIGDLHRGVPELRQDSRYNIDTDVISRRFSIGVDVLTVFAETEPQACIDHARMAAIDEFTWHAENIPGVQSVLTLGMLAKLINAGWNEGAMTWRVLPRDQTVLAQAVSPIDTSSGLLNSDCSVMPVLIFTDDHKAETIERIVESVKRYREAHTDDGVTYALAGSNVGVMAATNEAVDAAQFPILVYVYAAIIVLCLLTFRSLRATLCIVLPLALVSVLAYALMTFLEIGLKVSTLPVVALGVGIGVDYGIYIFSRLQSRLERSEPLEDAFDKTLRMTGIGVLFTGLTLAVGVATWIFSPLKFQADMGILLTFMFLLNMIGALVLLPTLARWLIGDPKPIAGEPNEHD